MAVAAAERAAERAVAAAVDRQTSALMMNGPRKRKPTAAAEGSVLMAGVLGLQLPSGLDPVPSGTWGLDLAKGAGNGMGAAGRPAARRARATGPDEFGSNSLTSLCV